MTAGFRITDLPSMVTRCPADSPRATTDEVMLLVLPGVSGVVILTATGVIVGYRRAKAHLAVADTVRRFIR